jgi:hypothetical protein
VAKRKNPKPHPSADSGSDCLQLLSEFVQMFHTIPQSYCMFCEANTALGIEAQKDSCPFRRAWELTNKKKPPPKIPE